MGIVTKLAIGTALVVAGYYVGHYMVPPTPSYDIVQRQGIDMVVNSETKAEYVKSDLPNVVKFLGKQTYTKLEEVLKNK